MLVRVENGFVVEAHRPDSGGRYHPNLAPGQIPAYHPDLDWREVVEGVADQSWLAEGEAYTPPANITTNGLAVTLSVGYLLDPDGQPIIVEGEDAHTFDSPAADIALAVDVIQNEADGSIELGYNTWDPAAVPAQTKGDPPDGYRVLVADLVRGILPAGSTDLADLQEEV